MPHRLPNVQRDLRRAAKPIGPPVVGMRLCGQIVGQRHGAPAMGERGRLALPRKSPHAGRKRNGAAQVANGVKPLATQGQDSIRARRGQVQPLAWVKSRTGRGRVAGRSSGRGLVATRYTLDPLVVSPVFAGSGRGWLQRPATRKSSKASRPCTFSFWVVGLREIT